jgi:hypothetical protein
VSFFRFLNNRETQANDHESLLQVMQILKSNLNILLFIIAVSTSGSALARTGRTDIKEPGIHPWYGGDHAMIGELKSCHMLALNFYSTGTGRNITACYSFELGNNSLGVGAGYNINSVAHPDDQGKVYYKRLYVTEPPHHLNLNLFYHHYVFRKLEHLKTFIFFDFQGKHAPAMNRRQPSSAGILVYHGPYYWLDATIGAGFHVNIAGNFYLQQKGGFGGHIILKSEHEAERVSTTLIYGTGKPVWEFIGLLNIGIAYVIGGP